MDLSTRWLGLELAHPVIPGASPLALDLDNARLLEDSGAAAIVLPSLFELRMPEETAPGRSPAAHGRFIAHGSTPLSRSRQYEERLGPDEYLEQISRTKVHVGIPVVASVSGMTPNGWMWASALMEQAGADAIELNVYAVPADPAESGCDVEERVIDTVVALKHRLHIPIAVKLSPYYSSLTHFASRLQQAGADGVVLFNRFVESDVDPDGPGVLHSIAPSDPRELLLRLRWAAILAPLLDTSLAVTGGVHSSRDVAKALLVGADVVQVVSALLLHGIGHMKAILQELTRWMEESGHDSMASLRGRLCQCPERESFESVQYTQVTGSWHPWF